MYKISVNNGEPVAVERTEEGFNVNGESIQIDAYQRNEKDLHILQGNRSYNVELVSKEGKEMLIKVNGNTYRASVKDRFDQLLQQMGMEELGVKKVKDVKAPMPGLVLNILVEAGQEVKKGENLLVLEAMKMENILKSPADGIIGLIYVNTGDKLEKNAVLLDFQ